VREGSFRESFGPGLLWAATAIGVSHLIQSTRAGADAGFGLVWIVALALVVKYPFFDYGARYAAATGESLVEGYARQGRWALWLYLAITLTGALIVQAAVVLFTAVLLGHVLGLAWALPVGGAVVLAACAALLRIGRFPALDVTIKGILVCLAVSTLLAAAVVVPRAPVADLTPWPLGGGAEAVGFAFILALVGWMPSGMDSSVWSSLWTLAKDRASGARTGRGNALLDFRIGYVGTGLIALAFLTLGAGVMHATGQRFSSEGTAFSLQLVDLYAGTLGAWSRPVILVAVLTTMFSTTLTVMDGFPRSIARTVKVLRDGPPSKPREQVDDGPTYWLALVVIAVLTVVVLGVFVGNLTTMIDFATTVSFVTAPILGWLNLRAVTGRHVPRVARPGRGLVLLSWFGLLLLGGTAAAFLWTLVFV
jgi:Mn2+/Fe2+ NRAMP family transporter